MSVGTLEATILLVVAAGVVAARGWGWGFFGEEVGLRGAFFWGEGGVAALGTDGDSFFFPEADLFIGLGGWA